MVELLSSRYYCARSYRLALPSERICWQRATRPSGSTQPPCGQTLARCGPAIRATPSRLIQLSTAARRSGPFFLELYRYTGERRYLNSARSGADALLNAIQSEEGSGLYEGIGGIGFTLGEAYLITHDAKYREGTLRCVELLREGAKNVGSGIEWNDTTDVIAGASGTGLFLLWVDERLHAAGARELAIKAGARLLDLAHPDGAEPPTPRRLKWMMDSKFPREMPNFSHGTAGVAYFLATLYQRTHEQRFLDAAVAGANYLLSIADKESDYCLIFHDNENKHLYYLSWCHGPAGDPRPFLSLFLSPQYFSH